MNQAKANPKAFYQYVNSKTKSQTRIADLKSDDGHVLTTNRDKAELFNRFLAAYSQWKIQTICPQRQDRTKVTIEVE